MNITAVLVFMVFPMTCLYCIERIIVLINMKDGHTYKTKKEFWIYFLIPFYGISVVVIDCFLGPTIRSYRNLK
jgi:hypothetical protein